MNLMCSFDGVSKFDNLVVLCSVLTDCASGQWLTIGPRSDLICVKSTVKSQPLAIGRTLNSFFYSCPSEHTAQPQWCQVNAARMNDTRMLNRYCKLIHNQLNLPHIANTVVYENEQKTKKQLLQEIQWVLAFLSMNLSHSYLLPFLISSLPLNHLPSVRLPHLEINCPYLSIHLLSLLLFWWK